MGFLGGVVFTLLIIATIFFWLRWVTQRRAAAARELEDDVEALPRSAAAAQELLEDDVEALRRSAAAAREVEAARAPRRGDDRLRGRGGYCGGTRPRGRPRDRRLRGRGEFF
jgi:hypothetical protein